MEEESREHPREQEGRRMRLPKIKGRGKLLSGNPIEDFIRFIMYLFGKAKNAPKSKLGRRINKELRR